MSKPEDWDKLLSENIVFGGKGFAAETEETAPPEPLTLQDQVMDTSDNGGDWDNLLSENISFGVSQEQPESDWDNKLSENISIGEQPKQIDSNRLKELFASGAEKIENIKRGAVKFLAETPQALGGLIKEAGERAEEKPSFLQNLFTPAPLRMAKGAMRTIAKTTDVEDKLVNIGDKIIQSNKEFIEKNEKALEMKGEGFANELAYGVGSGLASFGAAAATTMATRSPALAGALFGFIQKSNSYLDAREKGKSPKEAGLISTAKGLAEGGLEFVGLDMFFNKISAKGLGKLANAGLRALTEATQEMSQTGAEKVIGKITGVLDKDETAKSITKEIAMSGLIGGLIGGGSSMVLDVATGAGTKQKLIDKGLTPEDADKVIIKASEVVKDEYKDVDVTEKEVETEVKKLVANKDVMIEQVGLFKKSAIPKEDLPSFIKDENVGSKKVRKLTEDVLLGKMTEDEAVKIINEDYKAFKGVTPEAEVEKKAFHGTQAKQIKGTPNPTKGSMGKAFYLTDTSDKAKKFGKDKNVVNDTIRLVSGKKIKQFVREPNFYKDSNVFEMDVRDLKIKEFKNDSEFFGYVKNATKDEYNSVFRLSGYDGAYIKDSGTYAIYNPEKLKTKQIDRARLETAFKPKEAVVPEAKDDPLIEEAKKYKTAEEFVENKINVFHGTPYKFDKFELNTKRNTENETNSLGVWLTTDKKSAEKFAKQFEHGLFRIGGEAKDVNGNVIDSYVDIGKLKVYEAKKSEEGLDDSLNNLKEKLKEAKNEIELFKLQRRSENIPYQELVERNRNLEENKIQIENKIKDIKTRQRADDSFEVFMDERDEFVEYISGKKGKKGAWRERYVTMNKEEANKLFIDKLQKEGYEGILIKDTVYDAKNKGDKISQVVIFSPENIKTKQQLTDIWNKANKQQVRKKEVVVPTREEIKEMKPVKAYRTGEKVGKAQERNKLLMDMRSKKSTVEQLKKALSEYANKRLSTKDKGKLLTKMRDLKTKDSLNKAMDLIDTLEEKAQRGIAVDKLKKTIKKIDFKKLRPEYKSEILDLVNSVDLVNRRDKTIKSLNNTLKFMEENPDNNIPEDRMRELRILEKKKIKDLTLDDINLLRTSIIHAKHLMDLKNKLIVGNKYKEFADIKNEAITNINKRKTIEENPNVIEEAANPKKDGFFKKLFTTWSLNTEVIADSLDNQDNGIIQKIFYEGIDEGVSKEIAFKKEAHDFLREKTKGINMTRWSSAFIPKNQKVKELIGVNTTVDWQKLNLPSGKQITLSKASRVSLALHSLNEKALRHLLNGGFSFAGNEAVVTQLSADDLNYIIDSMTKEEQTVADAISEYFNTIQKEELDKTSTKLNGFEIATEKNYFPIITNALARMQDKLAKMPGAKFMRKTLEGMGMLKPRTSASTPIILEDALVTTVKSIEKAAAYVGLANPIRNARALLGDSDFKLAVTKNYGKHVLNYFEKYLNDIEGAAVDTTHIDKLALDVINKLDVAILGWNPWVMLKQPISYMGAATEMDAKYLQKAATMKPASKELMSKWSPQLWDRFNGNVTRELGEIASHGKALNFWTDHNSLGQTFMKGIGAFDYQAIGRIWTAATLQIDDTTKLEGDERMKAIAKLAEKVIRRTQPTFHPKDRSQISRERTAYVRLLTKYSSQRNKNFVMIYRAVMRYNRSQQTVKDKIKLVTDLGIVNIMSPLMLLGVNSLRNIAYGREPDKDKPFSFWSKFFDIIEFNFGNIYFVGNAFSAIKNKYKYGRFTKMGTSNVLESVLETSYQAIADFAKAIEQASTKERFKSGDKRGQKRWKHTLKSAINNTISVTSRFRGIPYDNVVRLSRIFRRKKKKKTFKII